MSRETTERKFREQKEHITVTWITPVRLVPEKRIMVVGVCSDCDPEVAQRFGVKL